MVNRSKLAHGSFNMESFKENLSYVLKSKNIMGKELAENVHISEATISRYISGQRLPDIEYVYRICTFLGVSMDWLVGLSDSRNEPGTPKEREVAHLYSIASEQDQLVVDAVLNKYKKELE